MKKMYCCYHVPYSTTVCWMGKVRYILVLELRSRKNIIRTDMYPLAKNNDLGGSLRIVSECILQVRGMWINKRWVVIDWIVLNCYSATSMEEFTFLLLDFWLNYEIILANGIWSQQWLKIWPWRYCVVGPPECRRVLPEAALPSAEAAEWTSMDQTRSLTSCKGRSEMPGQAEPRSANLKMQEK